MATKIRDRDHLVEICHDLIDRAMRCESQPESRAYGADYRAKEAAIRRALAVLDAAEVVHDVLDERLPHTLTALVERVVAYRTVR